MSKDIELIAMFGIRRGNDDGFTYVHGKFKNGRKKRGRRKLSVIRSVRHDKRSVKGKAIKRIRKEIMLEHNQWLDRIQ